MLFWFKYVLNLQSPSFLKNHEFLDEIFEWHIRTHQVKLYRFFSVFDDCSWYVHITLLLVSETAIQLKPIETINLIVRWDTIFRQRPVRTFYEPRYQSQKKQGDENNDRDKNDLVQSSHVNPKMSHFGIFELKNPGEKSRLGQSKSKIMMFEFWAISREKAITWNTPLSQTFWAISGIHPYLKLMLLSIPINRIYSLIEKNTLHIRLRFRLEHLIFVIIFMSSIFSFLVTFVMTWNPCWTSASNKIFCLVFGVRAGREFRWEFKLLLTRWRPWDENRLPGRSNNPEPHWSLAFTWCDVRQSLELFRYHGFCKIITYQAHRIFAHKEIQL